MNFKKPGSLHRDARSEEPRAPLLRTRSHPRHRGANANTLVKVAPVVPFPLDLPGQNRERVD